MDKKPKRRWFQFSLRTLLLAVTIVAMFLALFEQPVWRKQRAIAELEHLGATIGLAEDQSPTGRILRRAHFTDSWYDLLLGKAACDRVVVAQFAPTMPGELSADTLRRLSALPRISCIYIQKKIDHAWLSDLERFPNLDELTLDHEVGLTDESLQYFVRLPALQYLIIVSLDITDNSLPHLEKLTDLRLLHLWYTKISADGEMHLRKALPGCSIHVYGKGGVERSVPSAAP